MSTLKHIRVRAVWSPPYVELQIVTRGKRMLWPWLHVGRASIRRRQCKTWTIVARVWCANIDFIYSSGADLWPDNLHVEYAPPDHYEIMRKVGCGKYSEVILCIFISSGSSGDSFLRFSRVWMWYSKKDVSSKSLSPWRTRGLNAKSRFYGT